MSSPSANQRAERDDDGEHELYDLLNVSRDATEEEIRVAYRRLCQTYHPDKHKDEAKKEAATRQFMRINTAYEVLSDPLRRRAYDEFGMEGVQVMMSPGLELSVWEDIAARFRGGGDSRDGRKARRNGRFGGDGDGFARGEDDDGGRDSLLSVHNQMKVNVDATGLISLLEDDDVDQAGRLFVATQTQFGSDATAYVTNRDTFNASYNIGTKGWSRAGSATLGFTARRTLNADCFAETSYMYSAAGRKRGRALSGKVWRKFSDRSSGMLEMTYSLEDGSVSSMLSSARQLSERWFGQLAWISGSTHGVMFTLRHSPAHEGGGLVDNGVEEDGKAVHDADGVLARLHARVRRFLRTLVVNFGAKLGTFENSLSLSLQKGLGSSAADGGLSGGFAKLRGRLSYGGWDMELGGGRNLVESGGSFGAGVALSNEGVLVRLKLNRGGHKLLLPVMLSSTSRPGLAAAVASLLISLTAAVQVGVVLPLRRQRRAEEKAEAKRLRSGAIERAREEAFAALDLMQIAVQRCREREREVPGGGLIITRALFGSAKAVRSATVNMPPFDGRELELEMVDVTDAMQYLVEDSKLLLHSSSKSSLMGVWDPTLLPDEGRLLRIWYEFRGRAHEDTVEDYSPVELPQSTHILHA